MLQIFAGYEGQIFGDWGLMNQNIVVESLYHQDCHEDCVYTAVWLGALTKLAASVHWPALHPVQFNKRGEQFGPWENSDESDP